MHVDEGTAELEPVQTLLPDLSPLTATRHLRHSQLPHTSQTTNPHADTPGPLSVPNRSCDPIPHSLTAHPGRPPGPPTAAIRDPLHARPPTSAAARTCPTPSRPWMPPPTPALLPAPPPLRTWPAGDETKVRGQRDQGSRSYKSLVQTWSWHLAAKPQTRR